VRKDNTNFQIKELSPMRRVLAETLSIYEKKHSIHALVEFDVTKPRELINRYQDSTGKRISFTAYIVNCVGKAVDEDKKVQALRLKKKKIIIFDDVDIATLVERKVDGESWPTYKIIRAVNQKSLQEIHDAIRAAQVEDTYINDTTKLMKRFLRIPRFIRMRLRNKAQKNPFMTKRHIGTVVVTAVGMFGIGTGWGIPYSGFPPTITIGGIIKKPGIIEDIIETREYLMMTITLDHDIIDGAPAARFISRLKELIESGFELG
jgi:pyruvate/2-oxoglutarate dehydrogenase complex dihydrolipoamide acyltransferase (E2) component